MGPIAGEITVLLQKAGHGDRLAADQLYRLVEKDLRAIAGKRKRHFDSRMDGSTTLLVDDAFMRLVGSDARILQAGDRAKFFCFAANKIHDLLVEASRANAAQKRGGDRRRVTIDAVDARSSAGEGPDHADFIIDLHAALDKMDAFAEAETLAFRIYYFLGCTFEETADVLQVSATEVKRRVRKAQMWLQRELKGYES